MNGEKRCTIAVLVSGQARIALEVCIKKGNVYVNYFDKDGKKRAHTSYHSSGQKHIKKNGDYVYWTGGASGKWEPMKFFKMVPAKVAGREEVSVIGWELSSLGSVLPPLSQGIQAEVLEVPSDPAFMIVGFKVSVVGLAANSREGILGFPVFWRYRLADTMAVEIEAFGINQELGAQPWP